MLIYAIRHGQTDWNAEGRLQGAQDIPLNALGRRQALDNGRALAAIIGDEAANFDFVASPLGRTRETMELVREGLGLSPGDYRTDDRLIEVSFGDWEGHTLPEISAARPGRVEAREADKWHFQPPGERAESYEILSWRIAAWLKSVEKPTVCVCHGGVIRSFFHLVGNMPGEAASKSSVPQDRILKIDGQSIGWVDKS